MNIKADQDDYKTLLDALNAWVENGNITAEKTNELKSTIIPPKTIGQQIAQYFFFIALSCILLAFAALFIDDKFLERFKLYFSLTNLFIALLFTILSIACIIYLKKKKHEMNTTRFEVYAVLVVY